MTPARKWILLAVAASLIVAVAGWFLVISPARAQASQLTTQADGQAMTNQQLQISIAQLRRESQELQSQQKRLQELEKRIPEKMELSDLIKKIATTVNKAGGKITAFTPTEPQALNASNAATTPTSATTGANGSAAPSSSAATGALYMVPLNLTVRGSFGTLEKVLKGFEGYNRVFLVTSTGIQAAGENAEVSGDTLTMTVTGRVFTRTNEFTQALSAAQNATTSGTTTSRQEGLG